jgi:hypothetical protein
LNSQQSRRIGGLLSSTALRDFVAIPGDRFLDGRHSLRRHRPRRDARCVPSRPAKSDLSDLDHFEMTKSGKPDFAWRGRSTPRGSEAAGWRDYTRTDVVEQASDECAARMERDRELQSKRRPLTQRRYATPPSSPTGAKPLPQAKSAGWQRRDFRVRGNERKISSLARRRPSSNRSARFLIEPSAMTRTSAFADDDG